jgi:hypothetical protein
MLWALDLAETTVNTLKARYTDETRPQTALDASRAWVAGEVKMRQTQRAILDCHAFAKEIASPEDIALRHASRVFPERVGGSWDCSVVGGLGRTDGEFAA